MFLSIVVLNEMTLVKMILKEEMQLKDNKKGDGKCEGKDRNEFCQGPY